MFRLLILLILFSAGALTPARAQQAMTGAEFDAYTRGKTLTYYESDRPYGIEQYLGGRRVTWAFDDGECQKGTWFEPEPALICFSYENTPDDQCWNFFQTETGLRATFIGETPGDAPTLYEARRSRYPLLCLGPEVGV
jgi:hypothetical protein